MGCGNWYSFGFMPLRKDYLLDQLRDFFAALNRIADRIQAGELERAEEEIEALSSPAAVEELLRASGEAGSPGVAPLPGESASAGETGDSVLAGETGASVAAGETGASTRIGEAVPEHTYAAWKFQAQLLLLKIRVLEARGFSTLEQRAQAVLVLRKLIALRPGTFDIELEEQLRGLEKS